MWLGGASGGQKVPAFMRPEQFPRRWMGVNGDPRPMRRSEEGTWYARAKGLAVAALGCLALANCSSSDRLTSKVDPKYGVTASPRVVEPGELVPKGGGTYRVGKPYVVAGRLYVPEENRRYRSEGMASWYGDDFHGRLTANGEIFDMESISAAHPTLPLPSYVRVTNLANHRSVVVRVNDRGPYHGNREIDVSVRAAQLLGFHRNGVTRVRVEYIGSAPLEGSDDRKLMATLREGTPAPAPSTVMIASARPFLPRLADTPIPPERPFDLGQPGAEAREPSLGLRRTQVTAAPLPGVAYVAEKQPPPWLSPQASRTGSPINPVTGSPTSAYAPSEYLGAPAVTSGRGLY
jgi:rare lipoprotein A